MMPVTKEALKQGLSTIRSGLDTLNTDKHSSVGTTIQQQYFAVVMLCVTFPVSLSALSFHLTVLAAFAGSLSVVLLGVVHGLLSVKLNCKHPIPALLTRKWLICASVQVWMA